jgi:predicted dienelactone hydrolase
MKTLICILLFINSCAILAQFPIGVRTITYNDPTRTGGTGSGGGPGRQIECAVYYPATSAGNNTPVAEGKFPIVVFGHGFAMAWSAYQNVWEYLTPRGYIMIFPKTESSIFPTPSHNDFGLDLVVASNRLLSDNSNPSSPFYQKINGKSAIMGHSMGGGATMLAAQNNDNIKTIIGLAPAETNPSAIAVTSNITVPALILSGSADGVTPPNEHHIPIFNGLASSCKFFVSITGGAHCFFANPNAACDFGESTSSTGITINRAQQQAFMNSLIGSWLDFYLKGICDSFTQFQTASAASGLVTNSSCSYSPISFEVVSNDATQGQNNGSATVTWSGGSAPFNFSWFDGSTNPTLNNLAPGTYSFSISDAFCTISGSATINSGSSSLEDYMNLTWTHYPNPSKGIVFLELPNNKELILCLYDASGRKLLEKSIANAELNSLDLDAYASGVYMLSVSDYFGNKSFKLLVKE